MNPIKEGLTHLEQEKQILSLGTRIPYYPLAIKEAKGSIIWDFDGNEVIDFLSGACVANTGHAHPTIVDRIIEQSKKLVHYNPAYACHEQMVALASELVRVTPGAFPKRVSFGLSGGDANDTAIKAARSFTKRQKIISYYRSYHGTTYGALSLSGVSLAMRRHMGPFLPEVYHIPFPDCYRCRQNPPYPDCGMECFQDLRRLLDTIAPPEEVAALFIEPIQGDSGVIVPPQEYIDQLVHTCRQFGILVVADEVQSGFGRSGKWFASEHFGLEPDIVVLGKSIASGMPLSAVVARKEILEAWKAPAGAFSMAANPISCAAALATIEVIQEEGLVEGAQMLGKIAMEHFEDLKNNHPLIGDIRGKGLMIGVDLVKDQETRERALGETAKVCWRCWEKGLFLTFFSGSVLRIAPPLTISRELLTEGLEIISESVTDVEKGEVSEEVLERVKGW